MATPCLLLFVVETLVFYGSTVDGDVFASSAQLRMLVEGEVELIDALKSYVGRERQKLEELDRLIAEVEGDRRTTKAQTWLVSSVDHPVDAFRLIHRFTTTWKSQIFWLIHDSTAITEVKEAIDSLGELLPTDDDYDGAKLALIRLQKIYKLDVADVINGRILEQTTRPMTQQMAIDVAMFALDRKMPDDALLWLTHAQTHPVPPWTPLQNLYHAMSRFHAQRKQFLQAGYFAMKAIETDPSNVDYYLLEDETNDSSETTEFDWDKEHYHLCRQHLFQSSFHSDGTLSCFYERERLNPMLRTKVEMLFRSPDVLMIHDFVTDDEAAELLRMGKSKMERAKVGSTLIGRISESRLGKVAWLNDSKDESLVERISKRISEATGLETKHPFAEPLQLSNYGMGGHYDAHNDNFLIRSQYDDQNMEILKHVQLVGDRIATFMIYLNHVEAGGSTVFPLLNLGIRPVQNAAVFWYNYKRSGFSEPLSLHAGCPVLIGEKWVANKWIREFGQVFRRPCHLTIDL